MPIFIQALFTVVGVLVLAAAALIGPLVLRELWSAPAIDREDEEADR